MTGTVTITKEEAHTSCSSDVFAERIAANSPYSSEGELIAAARQIWWNQVPVSSWLEAFAAHPRIGDVEGLRQKFGSFGDHSRSEQSSSRATDQELKDLAHWNAEYENRFGHIFIICASGKSAADMLRAVRSRYHNPPHEELQIAAAEQLKITELRLLKLLDSQTRSIATASLAVLGAQKQIARRAGAQARSPITTHMLDTALGRPAAGVPVTLQRLCPGSTGAWEPLSASATNADGRVPDLLPPADTVAPGAYRLIFDTSAHMRSCKEAYPDFFPDVPFYPSAQVTFTITEQQAGQHFHVPLTWNPYGYSTYRGS